MLLNISNIGSQFSVEQAALDLFHIHRRLNPVYRSFLEKLGKSDFQPERMEDIPMLPIRFFKSNTVGIEHAEIEAVFRSSGTSGQIPNEHHVHDLSLYRKSFIAAFEQAYGAPSAYRILGLLPSYLERQDSSLVYMVNALIEESGDPLSGTYLNDLETLSTVLKQSESEQKPTLLIGVSFALLELAESHPMPLQSTIVMETGGMKGRRKELIRAELHGILQEAFSLSSIHSEYGMTELLSQAYSPGEGRFTCPPWMKVLIRDVSDPFSLLPNGRSGAVNIIDLANQYSCPFIASDDLGRVYSDGSFEILGRFDQSEVRGCNLLVV